MSTVKPPSLVIETHLTATASAELEKEVERELGLAEGKEFDMGELLKKLEGETHENLS